MYVIEVRNKETGEWDTELEGNCDSRRKYLKTHAEAVKKLRIHKRQWKCRKVE